MGFAGLNPSYGLRTEPQGNFGSYGGGLMCCDDRSGRDVFAPFKNIGLREVLELVAWYEGRKLAYTVGGSAIPTAESSSNSIEMPQVELGKTKIAEIYGPNRLRLTAYIQSDKPCVFVSEQHLQREDARLKLGAALAGDRWVLRRRGEVQSMEVRPLSDLDTHADIKDGDKGVLADWTCRTFNGGQCVNIFDVGRKEFTVSIKTPDDGMSVCRPYPKDSCGFTWGKGKVEVFEAADCAGTGVVEERMLATCQPN
jgi:hypothetical protein